MKNKQRGGSCIYTKQFNVCRKIGQDTTIDPECNLVDNRCVLKKDFPKISPTINKYPQIEEKALSELIYLSGSVSFTFFTYKNKNYKFLGDQHYSISGNCTDLYDIKCSYSSKCDGDTTYETNCYDLTY